MSDEDDYHRDYARTRWGGGHVNTGSAGEWAGYAAAQADKQSQSASSYTAAASFSSGPAPDLSGLYAKLGPTTGSHMLALPVFIVGFLALLGGLSGVYDLLTHSTRGYPAAVIWKAWFFAVGMNVVAVGLLAAGVWLKRKGDKELKTPFSDTKIRSLSELAILRGVVSNVSRSSDTSGHISPVGTSYVGNRAYVSGGGGSISTMHSTTFRVDGKPLDWSGNLEIADGDRVSVAARQAGTSVVCVSNETSNQVNCSSAEFFEGAAGGFWSHWAPFVILIAISVYFVGGRGGNFQELVLGPLFLCAAILYWRYSSKKQRKEFARLNDIKSQRMRILEQILRDSNGKIADAVSMESQIQRHPQPSNA